MNRSDLWLGMAGFLAGSVNAAAGGGTLLSFPSLLALGMSPLAANATSTVGLLPGSVASIFAYRRELTAARADAGRLLMPSIVGGVAGAWLLLFLGDRVFAAVVPSLLLIGSALLVVQPLVARWLLRRAARNPAPAAAPSNPSSTWPVLGVSLLVAIYAGYFGAGAGIVFLGAMGLLLTLPLSDVNALKVVMTAVSNGVAAITFAVLQIRHPGQDGLQFRAALPLCAGALLGGYLGVRLVRRLPPWALRAFSALVGVGIAFYMVLRK
ncbi:MAG TPA: sulfite exporter TauE/SafE family protein [Myxococcales bacterium]|nr:sulfite exporter TauE/SafE family protein [Myxococcales bacterium]